MEQTLGLLLPLTTGLVTGALLGYHQGRRRSPMSAPRRRDTENPPDQGMAAAWHPVLPLCARAHDQIPQPPEPHLPVLLLQPPRDYSPSCSPDIPEIFFGDPRQPVP